MPGEFVQARSTQRYPRVAVADEARLTQEVVRLASKFGRYGYRRVTLTLRQRGYLTNHKLVMKLMREEHLSCALRPKMYRSYGGEVGKVAPNRLNRHFHATQPNTKWATDITEFKVNGQKLYLSPILDLFNGGIVSYSLSKTPDFRLAMATA